MKFGKTFEQSLKEENVPTEWIQSAIQYKALKKYIRQVVEEIDSKDLSLILKSEQLHYVFHQHEHQLDKSLLDSSDHSHALSLRSDDLFFQNLYNQSLMLSTFQEEEEQRLLDAVKQFKVLMMTLTTSSKDKYKWREIFNLYIDFKLNLNSHFTKQTLSKFLSHFQTLHIPLSKKHKKYFESFIDLNHQILQFQSFQNLNSIAITKILKKFNKNTLLNPSSLASLITSSPTLINPNTIEQIISTDIIILVPQVDDYLCPICFQLAYKPIRLKCSHFFCLRCTIKLQRRDENKCPICRDPNVMSADEANVDEELIELMKKEFPRELKIKKRLNDKETTEDAMMELYGRDAKCVVM